MIILGIVFIAAAIALLVRDKIENYIAVSIIAVSVGTYVFAVAGVIKAGLWITIALSGLSAVFVIFKCIKDRKALQDYVFTPALLAFAVYAVILIMFNSGVQAALSPDSPYWVKVIKGICYYDDFWKAYFYRIHPQSIGMWGYLSIKTWSGWSDSFLIASHNIYKVSILLPLFSCFEKDKNKNKLWINSSILAATLFFLPYISDSGEYDIYSPDMIMGLLFGMGMVMFIRAVTDRFNAYYVVALVYFCGAVLTKRIGIVILAMLLIWCFYILLTEKRRVWLLLYLIMPLLAYAIFDGVNTYSATILGALIAAFVLKILVEKKSKLLTLCVILGALAIAIPSGYWFVSKSLQKYSKVDHGLVARIFLRTLVIADDEHYSVGSFIKLPILVFLALVVLTYLLIRFHGKKEISRQEKTIFFGLMVDMLVYLLLLGYLYVTQISSATGEYFQEALLGSNRYMKIIPVMVLCFMIYLIIRKYGNYRAVAVVCAGVLLLSNLTAFFQFILIKPDTISFNGLKASNVKLNESDNVGYIDMGEISHYRYFVLDIYPTTMSNVDELSMTYRKANGMGYMSYEELSDKLADCDYVYVYYVDDNFVELYNGLFYNQEDIKTSDAFYLVDQASGLLKLVN